MLTLMHLHVAHSRNLLDVGAIEQACLGLHYLPDSAFRRYGHTTEMEAAN